MGERPLLSFTNRAVTAGSRVLVADLSVTLRAKEYWAVLGPNGCGKTATAQFFCGLLAADRRQTGAMAAASGAAAFGAYVSFERQRRLLHQEAREYSDSRFESRHKRATVASYLFPELYPHAHGYDGWTPRRTRLAPLPVPYDADADHPLLAQLEAAVGSGHAGRLLSAFGLLPIRHRPIFALSTGEARKLMLVEALLSAAPLVILDEAFDGLDENAVQELHRTVLDELHSTDQRALMLVTHRQEDLQTPPSHVLLLGQGDAGTGYRIGDWGTMKPMAEAFLASQSNQAVGLTERSAGSADLLHLPAHIAPSTSLFPLLL